MRFILIPLILFSFVSAQNLDSLVNSSAKQVKLYKMMPLIPPEKLFAKRDTVISILRPLPQINVSNQNADLEKRVRDLEINVTKVSVILENMQKVNEKHGDKFDTIMRFLEAIITAIAGVITALIGVYFKGRKKKA